MHAFTLYNKIKQVNGDWFVPSDVQIAALKKLPSRGDTGLYGFINTAVEPQDFNAMVRQVPSIANRNN